MNKIDVYNLEGKKVSDLSLNESVFGLEKNDALVHQVYVAQAANRRSGSAHTKIRSAVRGGGRKPWKQKGTGNARTGSIRNPIWRGGGTIFGPLKGNNHTKNINVKMKKKALLAVLSDKVRNDKVRIVDSLKLEKMKTKIIADMIQHMKVDKKSTLIGFATQEAHNHLAARNIERILAMETEKLNVYDVLNTEYMILSIDSVKQLEEKYTA
jgi:large subunit ribosomal protein L4